MEHEKILQIAKTCHEANRIYCESIGDNSQKPWNDAPPWQKNSAYNGVVFKLEHPEVTPEDSHKNWLKEKKEQGWKFGKKKDAEKKLHPCMVPYDKLPEEQKVKYELFLAVVDSFR
jgi:DUF1680 family protein